MFPLTSKMNDKFPLTQDINIGVSVHVETVVLLSKGMVDSLLWYDSCGLFLRRNPLCEMSDEGRD